MEVRVLTYADYWSLEASIGYFDISSIVRHTAPFGSVFLWKL